MSSARFEPVGERARWRVIYDLLRVVPVGGVVTYDAIGEALKLDPVDDRHTIQLAARRALKELLRVDNRAAEAVTNRGYRVVEPNEHLRLAHTQQQRSRNALVRGRDTAQHVDLNGVEPEVRKALDMTARALSAVLDFSRRLDVRQAKLEQTLENLSGQQTRTDEEVATLRERLDRLEGRHGD